MISDNNPKPRIILSVPDIEIIISLTLLEFFTNEKGKERTNAITAIDKIVPKEKENKKNNPRRVFCVSGKIIRIIAALPAKP
tara:strand:- start:244 stop:489 length:246 start_codon:yes stop_codon:yes gene_type:complete